MTEEKQDSLCSVSYTHLDVYKRQVEFPAGKLPLCLFGKLFDTGLYPADLRIVVGKLVAFKGPRVAPPA